jgi:hypothetical protein
MFLKLCVPKTRKTWYTWPSKSQYSRRDLEGGPWTAAGARIGLFRANSEDRPSEKTDHLKGPGVPAKR